MTLSNLSRSYQNRILNVLQWRVVRELLKPLLKNKIMLRGQISPSIAGLFKVMTTLQCKSL